MKNEIAICIYGLPRGNKRVWNNIIELADNLNADIFLHSWIKPEGQKNHMGLDLNSGLSHSGVFKYFHKNKRLKAILFNEQKLNKPEFLKTEYGTISYSNQINSIKSMIFSRELAINYSESINYHYSHFLFTRLDCDIDTKNLEYLNFNHDFFHCGFLNKHSKKWEWEDVFFIVKKKHILFLDEVLMKMKNFYFYEKNIRNTFIYLFEQKKLSVANSSKSIIKIYRKKNFNYLKYMLDYRIKNFGSKK